VLRVLQLHPVIAPLGNSLRLVCRRDCGTGMAKAGGANATDVGDKLVPLGQRKYAGN
jgi:hypothetical protein